MADIAAGKGKGPSPFILRKKGKGDAVWTSRTKAEREALREGGVGDADVRVILRGVIPDKREARRSGTDA